MQKHGSLLEKLHSFVQIDDFSCLFTKWGTFCFFLLKSSWKCQDMVVCSKSCKFCWQFAQKVASFGHIDGFSCFFTKWGTFWNFFLKSSSKCKDMVVCSKSCKDLAKWMIFRAFSRNEALSATFSWKVHRNALQVLAKTWKSSSKCKDMVVFSKSCKVLAKSMIFRAFLRNEALFTTFPSKVHRNAKSW